MVVLAVTVPCGIENTCALAAPETIIVNKKKSVFDFRQLISKIPDEFNNLRQRLYKASVMNFSGPFTWFYLCNKTVNRIQVCLALKSEELLPTLLEELVIELENASEQQNGLQDCFSPDDNHDFSWTPYGKEKLREKSKTLDDATTVLQSACRKALASDELENLRQSRRFF